MPKSLEKENPFADMELIYSYSWEDAVKDGTKIEITELAKQWGFKIPVAVSIGLFSEHLKAHCEDYTEEENTKETDNNIICVLLSLMEKIKWIKENKPSTQDHTFLTFEIKFGNKEDLKCFCSLEGRSPENPEPVMSIYLPEEY